MWLERCLTFYKLAAEETYLTDEEEYHRDLKDLLIKHTRPEMVLFLQKWSRYPFFELKEILPAVYEDISTLNLFAAVEWYHLEGQSPYDKTVARQLLNAIVSYIFKHNSDFNLSEYMFTEDLKDRLEPQIFQLAQQKIMLRLLDKMKILKNPDATDADIGSARGWFRVLLEDAKYIPKGLLKGLAKRTSTIDYADIMKNKVPSKVVMLGKESLDEYDIELMFDNTHKKDYGAWTQSEFATMVEKATPAAREYLRTFLYSNTLGALENLFMLSEDMQPMDINYNQVSFPFRFMPIRLSKIINTYIPFKQRPIIQRWQEIFADFKIVPS